MAKIKNRSMVPSIQVVFRHPKGVIEWKTATQTFANWVSNVWTFCDGNGIERPTEDALDELACTQFPRWVCTGDTHFHAPEMRRATTGCSSCGGRRR